MTEQLTSQYAVLGDITGLCLLALFQVFACGMAWFWTLWLTALINVSMGLGLACVYSFCCSELTPRSEDGFLIFAIMHLLDATAGIAMASTFVAGKSVQSKEDEPFF